MKFGKRYMHDRIFHSTKSMVGIFEYLINYYIFDWEYEVFIYVYNHLRTNKLYLCSGSFFVFFGMGFST